jgi:prophage DNA circulation protein
MAYPLPATFRGISFLYISGDVNAGRKTVIHEYPNKDTRFVEDMGLNQRTFSIRGIITGDQPLYTVKNALLKNALDEPGIGILTHPTLGIIKCVCVGYTFTEDDTAIGITSYTMNFVESNEDKFPFPISDNTAIIANLLIQFYELAATDLNQQYSVIFPKNESFSANKLNTLADSLDKISKNTQALNTPNTDFRETLKNFRNNVHKISALDGEIGTNTSDLIQKFDSLSLDGSTRFIASSKFFRFGEDESLTQGTTAEVEERNRNQKLINGTINALSFINLCDSAKDIEYSNEDELNNAANIIDDAYDYLFNTDTLELTNEIIDSIDKMRNEVRIFFEQERLIVNKILEVETNTIPATVLAFQYYGDTSTYDEILSLNQIFNPAKVSGTVKIVEA